jgi:hypothetical protein
MPKNTLGPSIDREGPGWESEVEGDTTSKDTWLWRRSVGARKAKRDKIVAVNANKGAR